MIKILINIIKFFSDLNPKRKNTGKIFLLIDFKDKNVDGTENVNIYLSRSKTIDLDVLQKSLYKAWESSLRQYINTLSHEKLSEEQIYSMIDKSMKENGLPTIGMDNIQKKYSGAKFIK